MKKIKLLDHRASLDTARIYMMELAHRNALIHKVSFIISLIWNSLPPIDELTDESYEGYFDIVVRRYLLRTCWN